MVTYNEYLKSILLQILESYEHLKEINDKPGDLDVIKKELFDSGVRVEIDERSEGIPKKVRDAQLQKIPYILVVGDKEEENETVNVRTRDNIVHGEKKIAQFIAQIVKEVQEKT